MTTTIRDVHGTSSVVVRSHGVRVHLRSEAQPANTVIGKTLKWRVRVDGRVVFRASQGFSAHDVVRQHFADGSGKHKIKVFKNGHRVRRVVVSF